jgi:multiple antibiotic resistance protein
MEGMIHHAVPVFLGFFAIMNPFANTSVFIGLTGGRSRKEQTRIALKSLLLSFLIILVFSFSGKMIFHLFGISLPALRIAGGILVFIIGYQMLHGESSKMHASGRSEMEDPTVSPLAVPILAGPGTIATAMNFSASGHWRELIITITTFGILCIVTLLCFIAGEGLVKMIGRKGLEIITRLMGLILAVIGIQMLLQGVQDAIKAFGH